MELECSVTYHGLWNPNLSWTAENSSRKLDKPTVKVGPDTVTSRLIIKTRYDLHKSDLHCKVMFTNVKAAMHKFEQDLGMPGEKADNDPHSEEPLEATTPRLNILCEYVL